MGANPFNLALRFILELVAYAAMGYWAWTQHEGFERYAWLGLPIVWAILWGTFAVPGDPSRSGRAPRPVPGWTRLFLELAFFASAVWLLFAAGQNLIGTIFGISVLLHYALSYDRIKWLLSQ